VCDDSSSGAPVGLIAGVAIGAVLILLAILVMWWCCCRSGKSSDPYGANFQNESDFYHEMHEPTTQMSTEQLPQPNLAGTRYGAPAPDPAGWIDDGREQRPGGDLSHRHPQHQHQQRNGSVGGGFEGVGGGAGMARTASGASAQPPAREPSANGDGRLESRSSRPASSVPKPPSQPDLVVCLLVLARNPMGVTSITSALINHTI
jgi:hypothetical protein